MRHFRARVVIVVLDFFVLLLLLLLLANVHQVLLLFVCETFRAHQLARLIVSAEAELRLLRLLLLLMVLAEVIVVVVVLVAGRLD